MQKKDIELIASVIREENRANKMAEMRIKMLKDLVNQMAKAFVRDNPKFSIQQFLSQCGLQ